MQIYEDMNQVEYLGMNINSRGMSPVQGKVQPFRKPLHLKMFPNYGHLLV